VTERPLVHVVVVDHDGGDLTLDCLRSVVASDWPVDRLRIVLVDNASRTPVTATVTRELPTVHVVTSPTNLGFAGGANLGMRERGDADFVALLNNDATVTPGWLGPLVDTFRGAPDIGAACPKILLSTPAVEITLESPVHRRGRGDRRDLGVRVSGARVHGTDVWGRAQLVEGFWGYEPMPADEPGGQWTGGRARLRVPVAAPSPPGHVELRLAADGPVTVVARSGTAETALVVDRTPAWGVVASDATPVEVINNVGSTISADGYGADRGWLEVDRGQYDAPADVPAWCGAAVLLSRAYLDDTGLFDERLFLYYEDIELSLRGAARGWRYRTAPEAVVRHVHSASSIEGSPLAFHHNERNRLFVATRYARRGAVTNGAASTVTRYLLTTGSYARRDVLVPMLRGERPHPVIVQRRLKAFGAYVGCLVAGRRRTRS
jgi:hypothetical protein